MTFLTTGGTGKTGLILARLLHSSGHRVLITSRSGVAPDPFKAVAFDWFNPESYGNPFDVDARIDKVYLVGPPVVNKLLYMKPFIELAISKGVSRFVLLSATATGPEWKGGLGDVHNYLANRGVDFAILRPSWFFENFQTAFLYPIRERDFIPSTVRDGKLPFVAVEDIADVAFEALTADSSPNTDFYILGPQLLSYDEVAEIFSQVLGRTITHKRLTIDEGLAFWGSRGFPKDYASDLVRFEQLGADGSELHLGESPKAKIGRRSLRTYVEINKAVWLPSQHL